MEKEKQPLVDIVQGIKICSFSDNEPRDQIVLDRTKENAPKHGTSQESKASTTTTPESYVAALPDIWLSTFVQEYRCIYNVPSQLRVVNPDAYTPRMLLIGPLQQSKKGLALELSKTDLRYLHYLNVEERKREYLWRFEIKYGSQTIKEFRRIIKQDEIYIRASYEEPIDRINPHEYVGMILLDSVFILVFFLESGIEIREEDILFKEPYFAKVILEDLILLENQLPYFLLQKLCLSLKPETEGMFRNILFKVFDLEGKIEKDVKFLHFTDLLRKVRVATLGLPEENLTATVRVPPSLDNAEKLDSERVAFATVDKDKDISLVIELQGRVLKMPCFTADETNERRLRNIMALEQCLYPYNAYVCSYISFLNFLIVTDKDVDVLVNKGVVNNLLGAQPAVVKMVKDMCQGLMFFGSHYYDVAKSVNNLKTNCLKLNLNKSIATLKRVYFKDLWTGTATVAAVILLVLALLQTVASFIQVEQNANKPPPPPAPIRKP